MMSNSPARFSWNALFGKNLPTVKQLFDLSQKFKNSLRRLLVTQKYFDASINKEVSFKRRIFALLPQSADEYR